jgi:hypothetical protein
MSLYEGMMPFIVSFFLKVFIWQGSPTRLNSGTGRDRNNGLTVSLPSSQIISPNKSWKRDISSQY